MLSKYLSIPNYDSICNMQHKLQNSTLNTLVSKLGIDCKIKTDVTVYNFKEVVLFIKAMMYTFNKFYNIIIQFSRHPCYHVLEGEVIKDTAGQYRCLTIEVGSS